MNVQELGKVLARWNERDLLSRFAGSAPFHNTLMAYQWSIDNVTDVTIEDAGSGGAVIKGAVSSTGYSFGDTSECRILFEGTPARFSIETECDCAKQKCIHTYLLLEFARQELAAGRVPDRFRNWASWANQVSHRTHQPVAAILSAGVTLLWRKAREENLASVPFATYLIETQDSSKGKPRPVKVPLDTPHVTDRVKPVDLARIAVLQLRLTRGVEHYPNTRDRAWFESARQEEVFSEVLAAGGVSIDKFTGKPVLRGPDVTPIIQWLPLPDGMQRLTVTTESGVPVQDTLRLHGLWYYQNNLMGRLIGDADRLEQAMQSPPIAATQRDVVTQFLEGMPGLRWLPPVPPADITVDVMAKPVGVLRLAYVETSGLRGEAPIRIPVAYLAFDYDGWVIQASAFDMDGIAMRRDGTRTARIHENENEHDSIIAVVLNSGLEWATTYGRVRLDLAEVGDAYVNMERLYPLESIDDFLESIDRCEAAGLRIIRGDDFPAEDVDEALPYRIIEDGHAGTGSFELAVGIEIDGQRHDLAELMAGTLRDKRFPIRPSKQESPNARWTVRLESGQRIRLPLAALRQLVAPIVEWMDAGAKLTDGKIQLTRIQAAAAAVDDAMPVPRSLAELRRALLHLRDIATMPLPPTSPGFIGTLRPYQREGLRWLNALGHAGLGGILADDMGLGKTLQILAHLLHLKDAGQLDQPALVVVPPSLTGTWMKAVEQFTPTLRVLLLHGAGRAARRNKLADTDIALTTYATLAKDVADYDGQTFALGVFDESQTLKNPSALASKAARRLALQRVIELSGTPQENRTMELWSQMDLAIPGLLGERQVFQRHVATPIEKRGDAMRTQALARRIAPFLLRRKKEQVAADLPPKTTITRVIPLAKEQRALYEAMRVAVQAEVQAAIRERGLANSGIVVLAALLKLRQVCCHPRLTDLPTAKTIDASAKLDALLDLLQTAVAEGRRVLVFSFFRSMIDLIEDALTKLDLPFLTLTGETTNRTAVVDAFQRGEAPLFLLTLKAGGVGLNLTAADMVVHFDPWWNPAAENQATDRAHRIGQTKPVMVYRLIAEDTVEERILALGQRKANLAEAILSGAEAGRVSWTLEDISVLFGP